MSKSIGKFLGAPAVNNQDDGYQQSLVQTLQQYLAQNHMINDLAHVRSEFTDFDYFPNPLKEVLLGIQYNTGGLNKQNWHHTDLQTNLNTKKLAFSGEELKVSKTFKQ